MALESSMSEPAFLTLTEIKQISVRSHDKCINLLAQSISKHAMNAAVAGAARVAHNAVANIDIPFSARTVNADYIHSSPNSKSVSGAADKLSSRLSPRPKSREAAGMTKMSPRSTTNVERNGAIGNLGRANSGISVSSVATTPPAQYTTPSSAVVAVTPRDTVIRVPPNQKQITPPRSPTEDVDIEKMQLGLQGIKSMRARTASSGVRNGGCGDDLIGSTVDRADAPSSVSRAGSACRSRRRILNNSIGKTPSTSPIPDSEAGHLMQEPTSTADVVDVLTPRRTSRQIGSPRGTSISTAALSFPSSPGVNTISRSPRRSTDGSAAVAVRIAQELSGMWYEAKLLLRQVPRSDKEWKKMQQVNNYIDVS